MTVLNLYLLLLKNSFSTWKNTVHFLFLIFLDLNEREIFIGTPNAGSIKKMTELIDKGTNFSKILNQDFETKGHVVASVLKTFVRMLPETILTTKLYKNFVDVGSKKYQTNL